MRIKINDLRMKIIQPQKIYLKKPKVLHDDWFRCCILSIHCRNIHVHLV